MTDKDLNHPQSFLSGDFTPVKGESKPIEPPLEKITNVENEEEKVEDQIDNSSEAKDLDAIFKVALTDLNQQRKELETQIEVLEKRKSQVEKELKNSFTGQSDSIAKRVKGFQEYLTGALQDLANSTEQLDLIVQPVVVKPSPLDENQKDTNNIAEDTVPAISDTFKNDENLIRGFFEHFLDQPDFYAEPWKLRRSLENKDIQLLEDWFFSMGGRGAQPSRGSRSRNVLVAAGLISILGEIYGDRFQTLVLANQPERLGEWRRGLQDALGLTREDFGPNSGIMLFERGNGVIERADRLEERGEMPLILIDAAQQAVDIQILQFPLWLAFAAEPEEIYAEEEEFI